MASCSLFEEDEVCTYKPGKGYTFGLVLENSEFLSSGEEDEEETAKDRLHKGTVRVSWHPTGKETIVEEDKVQLLDRSLMPGDVVKRLIPGQDSQRGFVMNMDVRCHIHILRTNKYIYNVNSQDLEPLQRFEYGQEVMLDSWLGRIEGFDIQVILLFPDGARCQVDENDLCPFRDVLEKRSKYEFRDCPFYPGQEIKGHLDCLSDAKWLHPTSRFCHKTANKKGKSATVYVKVEKIVYKNVEIHWLSRGFDKGDSANESLSPPPGVIEGDAVDRLKVLDWFSHCSVQIGDHMTYRIKNDDVITSAEPAIVYDPKTAIIKDAALKVPKDSDHQRQDEPVISSGISGTSIDKDMDDGDDADFEDIDDGDKHELTAASGAGAGRGGGGGRGGRRKSRAVKNFVQRLKPGKQSQNQKLCNKKRSLKDYPVKPDDVVQVEVEFTTSWAAVMWQDGSVEKDIPSLELFPVHHLDDLEFFPGDFVLSSVELPEPADYGVVVKADHTERTCLVNWMKAYEVGKATAPTVVARNCEVSVYDITDHPDYKFRPGQSIVRVGGYEHLLSDIDSPIQAIGQIYEMDPNGHLVVKWANGSISQCYPQEVFILSEEIDDVSDNNSLESWASESDYDTDGSGETWETESENEIIGEDGEDRSDKDDYSFDQGAVCEHKQELDALLSRAETALVRLQKLLNVFDISAVSVPECFHDIIRIYRSCHDLDKILQSSFFVDPELQSLIGQAKKELRRDKANRISKHLSQLFEAWSNSLPSEGKENIGTVAFGRRTLQVSAQRKAEDIEISIKVPAEAENCDTSFSLGNSGAAGGSEVSQNINVLDSPAVSDLITEHILESKAMKESGEAAVSESNRSGTSDRRFSDPVNISTTFGTKSKKKIKDANLLGENCVSKAPKRTKSDGYDDSGHEAKKSKDESMAANHVAHELCYKICQNLQKQILKIHEEVNKRTRRLMNVSGKHNSAENKPAATDEVSELTSTANTSDIAKHDQKDDSDLSASVRCDEDGSVDKEQNQSKSVSSATDSQVQDSKPSLDCKEALKGQDNKLGGEDRNIKSVSDDVNELPSSDKSLAPKEEAVVTLEDVKEMQVPCKAFDMYGEVPSFHYYVSETSQPSNPRSFRTAVRKELKLFQTSLPDGIFIKGFEDRLDLYSVMILGPAGTPYEDALFLFDMMLPNEYPNAPPKCYYHSYCSERLNPNLYEDGKVCVSLLGTWAGKGTEVWTSKSNLLQVLISIQGLILVPEPYYNEAGYERQRGTQVGQENSRMYNEMAILKTVQSLTKMCHNLPILFKEEIYQYLRVCGPRLISRLRYWMHLNELEKQKSTQLVSQAVTSGSSQQDCVPKDHSLEIEMIESTVNTLLHEPHKTHTEIESVTSQQPPENQDDKTEQENDNQNPLANSQDPQFNEVVQAVSAVHIGAAKADFKLPKEDQEEGEVQTQMSGSNVSTQLTTRLPIPHPSSGSPSSSGGDSSVCNDAANLQECLPGDPNSKGYVKQGVNELNGCQESRTFGQPEFPLLPMSRGFCLTLPKFLNLYEKALHKMESPKGS